MDCLQEKREAEALAPPVVAILLGEDLSATDAEKQQKKAADEHIRKLCACYPSKEELVEHFGVR